MHTISGLKAFRVYKINNPIATKDLRHRRPRDPRVGDAVVGVGVDHAHARNSHRGLRASRARSHRVRSHTNRRDSSGEVDPLR